MGGNGLLGSELVHQARAAGHDVVATCFNSPAGSAAVKWERIDLRDRVQAAQLMERHKPDAVINTVYRQHEPAVTVDTAAHVAVATAAVGAGLVFVSSDAVFAGSKRAYPETAVPDPGTAYGKAKATAEAVSLAEQPQTIVARTSLIISDTRRSLHEQRVHAYARGLERGVLYTDDIRCPIHVRDLGAALLELAGTHRRGVHHLAGPDAVSRWELGRLIALRDGLNPSALRPGLKAESERPGPLEVRLDCTATTAALTTRLRGATEFLQVSTSVQAPRTPPLG